ncbi:nitrogen fixation/metabolism regulation signal transduction histidine kinase [Sinorhizobium kostiense]|uniref:Nitrogen fixation/metabolism regulation signal transduction histidine kinase n=1 Tax=Sinorhizobium kostiense TaxID=76747 RepID=A0ABS4QYM6_9HYPH|nr:hypothetical protein [Sinorhizobium kostiense]MBP2234677.1 nitrogen fixation/metabolism regulation signal transduction histidine kinase [Sinorhizobium kostiense]
MKEPAKEAPTVSAILFLLAGPILWAGHLLLVYGVQSVTCVVGSGSVAPSALIRTLVVLVTLGAILLLCLALFFPGRLAHMLRYQTPDRDNHVFSVRVERLLILLSLPAVIWSGAAAFLLDACGLSR